MDELPGSLGTSASLALRFGQTIFSTASLLFMCLDVEFYSYTAFWYFRILRIWSFLVEFHRTLFNSYHCLCWRCSYLVTVMGLVVPWSMTLMIVDVYSVFFRYLPRRPRITTIIILGDLALSYLSLAAACSTASTTYLLLHLGRSYCPAKLCTRYQLSAAMAFLSWFLSLGSSLFNLWLLPSL
ncbi:hypothetical protein DVH24_034232 [Malus domestica]|uniref:CASP-like protein n=1 Tax=Malus domestica TaxID=3750 RepID=A0A498KM10_MALDO|nr:hypothetical protein DVH24_026396 [Malus domestica]RXI07464.1 hypothetical protein DVH24_034232 [Malus domestica]